MKYFLSAFNSNSGPVPPDVALRAARERRGREEKRKGEKKGSVYERPVN